jgi:hypothetical protein
MNKQYEPEPRGIQTLIGNLSGMEIAIPDAGTPPMPTLAEPGVILNGTKAEGFTIDSARGYPDVRSFRRKFGLLIPATNTMSSGALSSTTKGRAGWTGSGFTRPMS